jgi:hypothetical protein
VTQENIGESGLQYTLRVLKESQMNYDACPASETEEKKRLNVELRLARLEHTVMTHTINFGSR